MTRRGPKGFAVADRPYRIKALELMDQQHLSATTAARLVVDERAPGGGTLDSKARRLQRSLARTLRRPTRYKIQFVLMMERFYQDFPEAYSPDRPITP